MVQVKPLTFLFQLCPHLAAFGSLLYVQMANKHFLIFLYSCFVVPLLFSQIMGLTRLTWDFEFYVCAVSDVEMCKVP